MEEVQVLCREILLRCYQQDRATDQMALGTLGVDKQSAEGQPPVKGVQAPTAKDGWQRDHPADAGRAALSPPGERVRVRGDRSL